MSTVTAVVLFFGVTAYALFAGADFGAGFWDLIAGGAERGSRPRALVDHSIGAVWEANHVWLIFVLVVLWTGFPTAFQSIMITLFVPLSLAALGIVMRGSSFAFRKSVFVTRERRRYGAVFALSSLLVPYCMGAVAGAIASGHVPAGGKAGDWWSSWVNPTSIVAGLLAVTVCAYLAAAYLVADARRTEQPDLVDYFRRRAIGAAVVSGIIALVGVFVLASDATYVFHGLTSRALPLVIISALCGIGSLLALVRDQLRFTRPLAMGAVAAVVIGWGVAQWNYLLPTTLTVSAGAAPDPTLTTILIVFVVAAAVILPSIAWLYYLDQHSMLGGDDEPVETTNGDRRASLRSE
jgi:cytochrome d ubiquinol oxidase subunit II